MTTKLEKDLKREVLIDGQPWVLTIGPERLKLVPKGKRNGTELAYKAIVGGDAGLAAALNASVSEGG